ncbi:MAG: amidohydrolase family protein [Clostridia bacterium]|nr:amidohydrolase family protein [Clostridia bacterium]
MLIDFHTHLFPDKIASRAIEALKQGIINTHDRLLLEPQTDGTLSGLLKSMDENRVDMSIVMPIATSPTQHSTINCFAKEITDNKRIISFGSVHPRQEDWEETLEGISENGLKGIKLHPEFQSFFADEPIVEKIVKKCEELGLWVLFHAGEDYGYKPPFHCTPQRLLNLIDKTGCKNIIAAHFGSFSMWEDVAKYLVGTDIYMDTSMTSGFLPENFCRDMILRHGSDKILFGSDSPWQSPRQSYEYLTSLNLSEDDLENIKHKNAERILNI